MNQVAWGVPTKLQLRSPNQEVGGLTASWEITWETALNWRTNQAWPLPAFCLEDKCSKFVAFRIRPSLDARNASIQSSTLTWKKQIRPSQPPSFPTSPNPVFNSSYVNEIMRIASFRLCCSEVWWSLWLTWHESPHWPSGTLFTCTSHNWQHVLTAHIVQRLTTKNRSPLRKTPIWLCRTHCGCAASPSLHLMKQTWSLFAKHSWSTLCMAWYQMFSGNQSPSPAAKHQQPFSWRLRMPCSRASSRVCWRLWAWVCSKFPGCETSSVLSLACSKVFTCFYTYHTNTNIRCQHTNKIWSQRSLDEQPPSKV